jgi:hypothetical protein
MTAFAASHLRRPAAAPRVAASGRALRASRTTKRPTLPAV